MANKDHLWKPGQSGNPEGRPKGAANKATTEIKQAYLDLVHGNLPRIQDWLNEVAIKDPGRALEFLLKLSPFIIPKKTEMDLNVENPIQIIIPPKKESDNDE